MDLEFQKTGCSCLDRLVCEVRSTELTQELRISDGMPDIGRVLSAWGQPILRSKEWNSDHLVINGGVLMWVLYAPEDGTEARCVDSWLPFQMKVELPEGSPEGHLRVQLLPKFSDARSLSARKLMLRSGASAMIRAYVPAQRELWDAAQAPEDVQLLHGRYPMRLPREAGEKTFLLDEDLTLPGSAPQPERLITFGLRPEVTDQKVTEDKVVFRGNGNLHLVYRSEEGQLHNWDFPLPFSQYAPLDGTFAEGAWADVLLCPTALELELDDEGHLRLKAGLTAQYVVEDQVLIQVLEDAYSPSRELQPQMGELALPAVLEKRRENLYAEQMLPVSMNLAADIQFLPDHPRLFPAGDGMRLEIPGTFQMLYYDENGALQGTAGRWEGTREFPADRDAQVTAVTLLPAVPQLSLSEGAVTLRSELPVEVTVQSGGQMDVITGIRLGQPRQPDPQRPSLVLQRTGTGDLWAIAKANGSTVEAIRKANGLTEDPRPGQLLLIPMA